ncbi:MAG: TetR/AcrR family transcriptional regulator [Ruminococcaceae bacterium]|nr:TetR/AcrR family transcriptional regulator [Oscillospiraceae bacterium]
MDLRNRIITTASELYQKTGLQFTMQEVATALNISKKTIYTVYPSKESLLIDMIDSLFADIHRKKTELAAAPIPIEDRIRSVIVAMPEQYAALDFRRLNELEDKYPAAARRVRQHLTENWEPTIDLLEEGIASGKIRPVSIPILKRVITASIESLLLEENSEGDYTESLKTMIDIIMNGIRRREDEVQHK